MRDIAFTVDVDRDVNQACMGRVCSVSKAVDGDESPRFSSSAYGLEMILDVLMGCGVRGTFFWEGRTAEQLNALMGLRSMMEGHEVALHGYDHEDFSGKETGIPLNREQAGQAIDDGGSALDSVFGERPRGFRAPYLRTSEVLMTELVQRNFPYDSSETVCMKDGKVFPYHRADGLLEAPVCWTLDKKGKRIVSYLWPYHEDKRPMSDYLDLVDGFEEGLLIIATHTWHMVECFNSGPLTKDRIERGKRDLMMLLDHARETGGRLVTVSDGLRGRHDL